MNDNNGFTVWLTGLPYSGKKQLAGMLAAELESLGWNVEILDGGKIRREYEEGLGFSMEEVTQNIKRIGFECKMLTETGAVAIAVTISPYKKQRDKLREEIGRFVEVYCRAPMNVLQKRDTKGLYKAAECGDYADVAGISAPYEKPDKPEVDFDSSKESFEDVLAKLLSTLQMLGYIEDIGHKVLTDEEEELIRKHLQDLGYI
ncbi:MAG: adenylyl-sulfate kinase [Acidobacteria bacterium]|nr:adenylyl-sulfate kinase [Acidobacteriota bacterium]MCG2816134.1 adenylyl-sulfate kinase [Candidatus Aminicenantes bacterium]